MLAISSNAVFLKPWTLKLHHILTTSHPALSMSLPIPQPPGYPLLGNITDVDPQNANASLMHLADKYGELSFSILQAEWTLLYPSFPPCILNSFGSGWTL